MVREEVGGGYVKTGRSVAGKTDGSNKFLPTVNEMRQEVRTTREGEEGREG